MNNPMAAALAIRRAYDPTVLVAYDVDAEMANRATLRIKKCIDGIYKTGGVADYTMRYGDMTLVGDSTNRAQVARARRKRDGVLVAVKTKTTSAKRTLEDNVVEVLVLKQVAVTGHPHIAQMYGAFIGRGQQLFIELQWAGRTILDVINEGRAPLALAACQIVCKGVLAGLEYCHRMGFLHGDLKLNNIMVDDEGVVRLTDFDSTVELGNPRRVCTMYDVNPAGRKSIEVVTGIPYTTEPDIWALAFCVVDMLAPTWNMHPGDAPETQRDFIQQLAGPIPETFLREGTRPMPASPLPALGFHAIFGNILPREAHDFVNMLFTLDPAMRPTAAQIKHSPFLHAAFVQQ